MEQYPGLAWRWVVVEASNWLPYPRQRAEKEAVPVLHRDLLGTREGCVSSL